VYRLYIKVSYEKFVDLRQNARLPCLKIGQVNHSYMVYGVWCMVYGVWCMVYGVWCMVNGVWCMVNGVWCMVYGVWCMVYGVWCMVYGEWCMVYGVVNSVDLKRLHDQFAKN